MQFAKSASFGWQGTFSGSFPQGRQKIRGMGYQFFGCTWLAAKTAKGNQDIATRHKENVQ